MEKTFVYLCRPGKNEELRYSIRSVNAFYPNATIWVVGGKPDWYIGNFLEVEQSSNAFQNVKNSLAEVIKNAMIPDNIIIMNDDFFFTNRVDDIKFYVSGTLDNKIYLHEKNGINSSYILRLIDLQAHCKRFKKPPLDFELHVPIPVNKTLLKKVIKDKVMWRSNYGNRFAREDQIEVMDDVKVYPKGQYLFKTYDYLSFRYPFVSTMDTSFNDVCKNLLRKMFPTKTRYEAI